MRVVFIVQSLFDGKFIGIHNGERRYFTNMKNAYRFSNFDLAMDNARCVSDALEDIAIHPLIEL